MLPLCLSRIRYGTGCGSRIVCPVESLRILLLLALLNLDQKIILVMT